MDETLNENWRGSIFVDRLMKNPKYRRMFSPWYIFLNKLIHDIEINNKANINMNDSGRYKRDVVQDVALIFCDMKNI